MPKPTAVAVPTETPEALETIQAIPTNMALMKMQDDTIVALAKAMPRDYEKIRDDLMAQLDAYPSFSAEAIYSKPVGKKDGKQVYATGPSIRMAEALAEAYGYNRVRCDVMPLPDGKVLLEASFMDYQRGRVWQDSGIVTPWYRSASGAMTKMPEDRFYDLKVKAEKSKLIREVILRSIPPGLRADLVGAAEKKLETLLDDKAVDIIVAKFSKKNVSAEELEGHVGRSRAAGWTTEDRKNLLGLWNALEAGEVTPGEIAEKQPEAKPEAIASLEGTVEVEAPPEDNRVLDLLAVIGDLSSKQTWDAFILDLAGKKLPSDLEAAVVDAWKAHGVKKGWRKP